MPLARAIECHVDAFVEHFMSPSLSSLAALKTSRQKLAEAAVAAIGAKSLSGEIMQDCIVFSA